MSVRRITAYLRRKTGAYFNKFLSPEGLHSEVSYTCAATGGLTLFQTLQSIWPDPTLRIERPGIYQIRVRTDDPARAKTIHVQCVKLKVPQSLALS